MIPAFILLFWWLSDNVTPSLSGLIGRSDLVVYGVVRQSWEHYGVIDVEGVVAGESSRLVRVLKPRTKTLPSLWEPKAHRLLLFLEERANGEYETVGNTGMGIQPIIDGQVLFRGIRLEGMPYVEAGHDLLPDSSGTYVALSDLIDSVRGMRRVYDVDYAVSPPVFSLLGSHVDHEAYAASSAVSQHIAHELYSSPFWQGGRQPVEVLWLEQKLQIDRDRFIGAVASVGDVDGDGNLDVAMLEAGRDSGDAVTISVALIDKEFRVRVSAESVAVHDVASGAGSADLIGAAIASLGDLDGNGAEDVVVGIPRLDSGGAGNGHVEILMLESDGSVRSRRDITKDICREGSGQYWGASLAALPGLGGGAQAIIVCGQDSWCAREDRALCFVAVDGKASVLTRSYYAAPVQPWADVSYFGAALAAIGDLDHDGFCDILIGDPADSDGGPFRGALWVGFMGADCSVRRLSKISDWAGGFTGLVMDGDHLGRALVSTGDMDGDNVPDIVVFSDRSAWLMNLSGEAHVLSARPLNVIGESVAYDQQGRLLVGKGMAGPGDLAGTVTVWERADGESR